MKAFNSLLVAKRWLKEYQVHVGEFDDNSTIQQPDIYQPSEVEISTVQPASILNNTLSKNQKYRKMLSLSQKLAVLASNTGMPEFRQKYSDIEKLISYWENNVYIMHWFQLLTLVIL